MLNKYQPQSLSGKKIGVTGGTTGIGRAIVLRLLADGANVLTFGRDEAALKEAFTDFETQARSEGGTVHAITAYQSKTEDVKRVFSEADIKLGGLDILVNNAALAASGGAFFRPEALP